MAKKRRFTISVPISREGSKEPYWHKIGAAWVDEASGRMNLRINSIPMNWDGGAFGFENDKDEED